jgi:hypothetical protein
MEGEVDTRSYSPYINAASLDSWHTLKRAIGLEGPVNKLRSCECLHFMILDVSAASHIFTRISIGSILNWGNEISSSRSGPASDGSAGSRRDTSSGPMVSWNGTSNCCANENELYLRFLFVEQFVSRVNNDSGERRLPFPRCSSKALRSLNNDGLVPAKQFHEQQRG